MPNGITGRTNEQLCGEAAIGNNGRPIVVILPAFVNKKRNFCPYEVPFTRDNE